MAGVTARKVLRGLVTVLGLVAVVAGAASMVLGVASVPGAEAFDPVTDSEFRFYATWYVVAGIALLRSARALETTGTVIRTVAWAFFAAGCARVVSWLVVGPPHWTQVILLVVELLMPAILIPWQRAVERGSDVPASGSSTG